MSISKEQQEVYEQILAEEYQQFKQYKFKTAFGEQIVLTPEFPQPYAVCAIMAMKRVHEMAILADQVVEVEPPPVHIGELNRDYGYNGFEPIVARTPVFEINDRYYFWMQPLNGTDPVKQTFYKEDLAEHINFINEPDLKFE